MPNKTESISLKELESCFIFGIDHGFGGIKSSFKVSSENYNRYYQDFEREHNPFKNLSPAKPAKSVKINNVFSSGIEYDTNLSSLIETENVISFEGESYLVGQEVVSISEDRELTPNMAIQTVAQVLQNLYPLIHEDVLEQNQKGFIPQVNIVLGFGLPLRQAGNEELVKKYRKYFEEDYKRTKASYKDISVYVNILMAECYPQGLCARALNHAKLKDVDRYLLVDLGYNTLDTAEVMDGQVLPRSLYTDYEGGVTHLLNKVKDSLEAKGIKGITPQQITSILTKNKPPVHRRGEEIFTICNQITMTFTETLISSLRKKYSDLSFPVVWMGGGYSLLKPFIEQIDSRFDENNKIFTYEEYGVFANADAYEKLISHRVNKLKKNLLDAQ